MVINLLADYSHDFHYDVIQSTGPKFLKDALEIYLSQYNRTAYEYVHIAPPTWFLPTYDPMQENSFKILCGDLFDKLPKFKKKACWDLKRRHFGNSPAVESYTDHHWIHTASADFRAEGVVTQFETILKAPHVI